MAQDPDDIRSQLRSAWKLHILPQTLAEILKITGSEDSGVGDLTRIILRDPTLTAKLLKLANSVTYGQTSRVTTVNQAVLLLGFRAVKSLALSTAIYDMFSGKNGFFEKELKQFWRHSLETAAYAQLFAARANYPVQEEAFVAGLIHDLGLIILAGMFPGRYEKLWRSTARKQGIVAAEDQELGLNHADAAAYLFTEWGLPEVLIDAVRYHHLVGKEQNIERMGQLTLIVTLADMMSRHQLEPGPGGDKDTFDLKYQITNALGLSPEDLQSVDSWVTANIISIAGYLDIDIGSPIEVLVAANDHLFKLFQEVEGLLLDRHASVRDEVDRERDKIAAEVMRVVSATFSHYINNATTTIMGHAQLIEMALHKGQIGDVDNRIAGAMKAMQNSVINITAILDELKSIPAYSVVSYHERSNILDVDTQIRARIQKLLENYPISPARTASS